MTPFTIPTANEARPFLRLALAWMALGLALFPGCATAPAPVLQGETKPAVVLSVPQRVGEAVPVSDAPLLEAADRARLAEEALQHFFAPWNTTQTPRPASEAFWGVAAFGARQGYAENLQPYPSERWQRLVALQDMEAYPSMSVPAIVTRNTAQRVLPSSRPFFLDPALPGEGFPFDYFQNSALWLGTPVLITHASLDGAWIFVESGFSYGWIRREDAAVAGADFRTRYQSRDMAAVLRDDTPLTKGEAYLGQAHIGAIFPVHTRRDSDLTIMVPLRDADGQAEIGLAPMQAGQAAPMPMPLTSRTLAKLADAMSGQLYGWGGMFENRDCSATMRDLFLPAGVWLPRNSSSQARLAGDMHELAGMPPAKKLAAISAFGRPFATFLWMPGHIGLYLGKDSRGEPLLLHNAWGVRTFRPDGAEGRAVIGRLAITTLHPGEERDDVKPDSFLQRIGGLTVIAPSADSAP